MAKVDTAFNQVAEQFAKYGQAVRGHVRYELTHRNLTKLASNKPLKVIDIGGGSGIDSLWLAELGHTVILAEPAKEQRKLAEERFRAADEDVRDRLTIMPGTTTELLDATHAGLYDLVLSHGVAMYMDEPADFVADLVKLAKPKGYISLLEKGYYGKQAHLVLKQNWANLRQLQNTHRTINNMGYNAWAFLPKELENMLKTAGAETTEWSGVRIVSDSLEMPVTDLTPQDLKLLVDIEFEQGHNPDTRSQGQMLHFIARKN